MALFEKKRDVSNSAPLYTVGADKAVLIVGLGNPGKKYELTRHNVGFSALDYFAVKNDFPKWVAKEDLKSQITFTNLGLVKVILIKPNTFMNLSGEAVKQVQRFYRIYNQNTLAIYDELALPFGQLRSRIGGSDAGHNGVKSLIAHIGEDFARLRIGVAGTEAEVSDTAAYVLKKFSKTEQASIALILRESNELINEFIVGESLAHQTRTIVE